MDLLKLLLDRGVKFEVKKLGHNNKRVKDNPLILDHYQLTITDPVGFTSTYTNKDWDVICRQVVIHLIG